MLYGRKLMENINQSRSNKSLNTFNGYKYKDKGSNKIMKTVYILNDLFIKNNHKKYREST